MNSTTEKTLEYVKERLEKISYGSVIITIHDDRVTQVDTTEKKRFAK